MPVSVDIEGEIAIFRCHGVLLFDEVMASNDTLLADPRSDHLIGQLIDFLPVTDYRLSEEEALLMSLIDKNAAEYLKPNRIAYVVRDPKIEAILEVYINGLAETNWLARIFEVEEFARAWLLESRHS